MTPDPPLVAAADVRSAAARIEPLVSRTPLVPTPLPGLWLKCEHLQRSGSFKARGAAAALTALGDDARRAGVVTHSSGNHGRALAEVGRALGCAVTVVMPSTAPAHKVSAVRVAGARVQVVPPAQRGPVAARLAAQGLAFVPPFDHDDVIAGQGSVGLEIAEQAGEAGLALTQVLVPVGGGGLVSGVAVALAGSGVDVVGVEPALAADLVDGLAHARRTTWPVEATSRTVADGLRLPAVGVRPWRHITALGVRAGTVGEHQILAAQRWLAGVGVAAEPSGAVSVAAALAHPPPPGRATVAVVSGGNVAPTLDGDPRE